ncbi:MAG TPA: TetR/AcrR family transcriptional regulator [Anaerolineales bacterium]|nr:TetR/AcrR family transcriptional regulator [Anaerolineales bacterium]
MLTEKLAPEKLDPRVRRTRSLLEQAFFDLVQEKGFQDVTVQDITERAGVNRATFYAHFPDKYALLDHNIRQGFLKEIDKRMLNACHLTLDNLRNLIIAVCEFTRSANGHCKPAQGQFESLVETQVKAVLHELMLKWLEQVPLSVPAETAATAASWAIYGLALQWSHAKQPRPVEAYAAEVLPLIASNLNLSSTGV